MKVRHGFTITVSVACAQGTRCGPAEEVLLNLVREFQRRLRSYEPCVAVEMYNEIEGVGHEAVQTR